ncbi:glutamine--tRNA ligase/YqeY domain fusion protein [Rubricoccus marinus]|uniref:Glutamine--tRNA ligase n=1 Tax=Rubricoccus marinus TaxID=716817 RepID=A0A259TZU5_9BACT|nr:glutamine--tRNA ligase/YqeY domain fusion protein [Rubricoccus marinus]OZC03305.1 glutamine--tRNA ligase [Rubricoccus marinus]
MADSSDSRPDNFLRDIIARDVEAGTHAGRVAMRFPPEPNGYPHLGHAQSIWLNFGLSGQFGGKCNLRFDDTNPETENEEFARALEDAVRWLGYEPTAVVYASDYFDQMYAWAQDLVRKGLAYVDSQSEDEIRAMRGTVTEAGTNSPFRDRAPEESLRLLEEMRRGEHPDGSHVLRAKIDMAHPNMKMRDPLMYRIRRDAHHYRTGTDWAIYPLYDWAHGQGDAIEGITHSVCTLEFDVNRPLYDWYLDAIGIPEPRNHQYEFARLNVEATVMSKRKLRRLVEDGVVAGWDDPRMPTIAGFRRRGIRPEAIRHFASLAGVSKVNGRTDLALLEHAIRDDLNSIAPRVMAVTDPVRLVIENMASGETKTLDAPYWPDDVTPPEAAPKTRPVPLAREVWIERADFSADPPKGWRRLAPDAEVWLRHGCVVKCTGFETDDAGEITEIRATADLDTFENDPVGRKVRGAIHWVAAETALPATFRLYDRLFSHPAPDELEDFMTAVNPDSLVTRKGWIEPSVAGDPADTRYQFERTGFFWQDPEDSASGDLVFNQIVSLKDGWARKTKAPAPEAPKAEPKPLAEAGPRDPASALSEAERETYSALAVRGVGREEAAVLAADNALRSLFESTVASGAGEKEAGTLVVHDVRRALGDMPLADAKASPEALAATLQLVADNALTRNAVGPVVSHLVSEGGSAPEAVEKLGLSAVSDEAGLAPALDAALADNPEELARYRAGETKLFGFFVGQAMRRAPKGADPKALQALLRQRLGA